MVSRRGGGGGAVCEKLIVGGLSLRKGKSPVFMRL